MTEKDLTGIFEDRYFIRKISGKNYIIKSGQGVNDYIPPVPLSDTAVFFLMTMSRYHENGGLAEKCDEITAEICAGFNDPPPKDTVWNDLMQLVSTLKLWDREFSDIADLM